MVITSLKLRLFARAELEVERPGSCGYLAKSSERQKSSISQKIVTISMQNSKGEGFGNQTVDLIYHIPNEFCFLFRRTHVKLPYMVPRPCDLRSVTGGADCSALEESERLLPTPVGNRCDGVIEAQGSRLEGVIYKQASCGRHVITGIISIHPSAKEPVRSKLVVDPA